MMPQQYDSSYNPYLDTDDGTGFPFKGWNRIYDETFLGYYQLLLRRVDRMKQLAPNSLDYLSYSDLSLVMLRAMCIESEKQKNNYTLQNFLRRHNRNDLVDKVNIYIDQPINERTTLRDALRTSVDKFIVHYDTIVGTNTEDEDDKNMLTDIWLTRYLFLNDLKCASTLPKLNIK